MKKGIYAFILLSACSAPVASRQSVPSVQVPVVRPMVVEVSPVPAPPLPPLQVRREKGITRYPVDTPDIVVRCPLLRVCDIELQPGEVITQRLVGDSRWWAIPSVSGHKEALTPHVGVKPTAKGIRSNLLILTNRRTYQLELVEGGKGERTGFLYPEERKPVQRAIEVVQPVTYEGYIVKGMYPWTPRRVWDDGSRTFIELPPESRVTDLPVLYITSNGKDELCNYAVQWPLLTVGRLITKAALVIGTGWKQQRVTITRGK